ncbi:MoxR family ATPase [Myxococcota bacterium]|nr:MoxR family ATPase [Myxococcota bacterium]
METREAGWMPDAADPPREDGLPDEAAEADLPPDRVAETCARIRDELSRAIVGQERVKELLLVALLSRGHGLFQGVPGLAKTLLVSSLARVTDCSFSRIQFTPDLMPGDITGTDVLEEDRTTGKRVFRFVRGPIFAHLVLADEVNRTPPRTQAALLQAMQEGQVSAAGQTFPLPRPFLVFATSNPLEQEGTYPLPEAQLDRFMFLIPVDYPSEEEELRIVRDTTGDAEVPLRPVVTPAELLRMQRLARKVPIADDVAAYAVRLARASRPGPDAPAFVREQVAWGAGPRASQYLAIGGKARALLHGRFAVSREDIRAVAEPVLAHRLIVGFRAEAEGVTARQVVARLVENADATGTARL